jgi:hypothetical protein
MANLDEQVAGFNVREDLLDARELKTLRDSLNSGFQDRHLDRIFGSVRQLYKEAQELQCIGNTQQIEALLTNPRVSGYMVTQLNDVAWEFHAGLLDVWRRPKPAYQAAKRVNRKQVVILRAARPCAVAGASVAVGLTLVSHAPLASDTWIEWVVKDPLSREVARGRHSALPIQAGIHALEPVCVEMSAVGSYEIQAKLIAVGVPLDETIETVEVVEPVDWAGLPCKVKTLGRVPTSWPAEVKPENAEDARSLILAADPAALSWQEWESICQAVETGSVAVVAALRPDNRPALDVLARHGLPLKLFFGIGSWMGCYHWVPRSDLFAGMPAGGLAKQPYTGILPKYGFSELGGEVLAGSLRNTQSRLEPPAMVWYSDVEAVRLGQGTVIFCQYRIFNQMGEHPLADRMGYNLLAYAGSLLEKQ